MGYLELPEVKEVKQKPVSRVFSLCQENCDQGNETANQGENQPGEAPS
jgi:hypothetical protein